MVIWCQNTQRVREETCCHICYSFWLAARVLLYSSSHRQDNTYHSLYYTSYAALAGTRNNSTSPPWRDRSDINKKNLLKQLSYLDVCAISLFSFCGDGTSCDLWPLSHRLRSRCRIWFFRLRLPAARGTASDSGAARSGRAPPPRPRPPPRPTRARAVGRSAAPRSPAARWPRSPAARRPTGRKKERNVLFNDALNTFLSTVIWKEMFYLPTHSTHFIYGYMEGRKCFI